MNQQQVPSEKKSKASTNNHTEEDSTEEPRMLGVMPSRAAHSFEDFSIFDHENSGDAFEPLPMDRPRTEQQTAAISRVFEDSIRLLQRCANVTRVQQPFETPAALRELSRASNEMEDTRATEVSATAQGRQLPDAVGSEIATNEAIRPIHRLEDHRISEPSRPNDEYSILRFRPYQTDLWDQRFSDLLKYRRQHGHCCVPHTYSQNLSLVRWVKRQRYQYKLRCQGKVSTMTTLRVEALEQVGFVWDSHTATWEERLNELKAYHRIHGHCEVPTHYQQNKKLATWVKCQRRQYKLYRDGRRSTMTPQRLDELEQLNFSWEMMSRTGTRESDD